MTRFSSFEHVLGCFYFPTISFSCSFIFTSVLVLQNSMSFLKMCYRKTGHCVLLFHLTVTIMISGVWEEEGQRKDMYCGEMLRNFCGMSLFYVKKVWGSFLCNMHLVRYREKRTILPSWTLQSGRYLRHYNYYRKQHYQPGHTAYWEAVNAYWELVFFLSLIRISLVMSGKKI